MAALASLTEMYTDSEGEEAGGGRSDGRNSEAEDGGGDRIRNNTSEGGSNRSYSRRIPTHEEAVRVTSRSSNLVSYLNDTVISDDEGDRDALTRPEPMDVTSEPESNSPSSELQLLSSTNTTSTTTARDKLASTTAVEVPPEPIGKCSNEMQQKIAGFFEKMKMKGYDMNQNIQERKSFRNPSIYEKLIQFCDINEFGTNYAPQIYDPHKWNRSSYYDELAKVQKIEMDKREKERKEKTKVEFIMGTAKKASNGAAAALSAAAAAEEERKRKSKWDQVGVGGLGAVRPPPAAGIVTLTSSSTGTKSTVISAFGSLPKKPKT